MNAFGIAVLTSQEQGGTISTESYAMCPLIIEGQPESVSLHIRAKGNGITPVAVYEMQPYEYEHHLAFDLRVPVSWHPIKVGRDDVWVPHTRQGEKDFMNVVTVDSDLRFMDVQISLLTRKGRFYIVAQLVYAGCMRLVGDEVVFIPSDPFFAYPGADYQTTWKGRGGVLATVARIVHGVVKGMNADLSEVIPAMWVPRQVPSVEGWKTGHVLFFCPITNTGHVLGEDGTTYHVWGNNLVDVAGPVHILEPMAPVYFRPGEQKEGQSLPSVKSCKPA